MHTIYGRVSSSLTTALLNNNFFKISSFRQHLLFTIFSNYAIVKMLKFLSNFSLSWRCIMDYTCRTKTLQALSKAMEKQTISLSYKLQREEGQWNRKKKTDLVDSLLRKYPINPTYGIKQNGVISIIDGVQRLSCVRDFISDKFALSKDMEPVTVNGEEKSLGGLKFSKLDDDTKDAILNSELQLYELTDCTEKDIREMFRRQNAGVKLNSRQLRVCEETDEFSEAIHYLAHHSFMNKIITNAQRKSGVDRDIIRQTLMLIMTNKENDYTSFKSDDINDFVRNHGDEALTKVVTLKEALDQLDKNYEELKTKQLNIPMILFVSYRCVKDKKSFSKLVESINQFLADYNEADKLQEYKSYCQSSTTSSENVRGRLDYWRNIIREL